MLVAKFQIFLFNLMSKTRRKVKRTIDAVNLKKQDRFRVPFIADPEEHNVKQPTLEDAKVREEREQANVEILDEKTTIH